MGFCVLEWSKLRMFQLWAVLKDKYKHNVRLLYTDTDSFIFQVFVEDFYRDINYEPELRDWFDFSNVPANHPSGFHSRNAEKAGVVGFFKEENSWDPVTEFVGLRPKMYSFKVIFNISYALFILHI